MKIILSALLVLTSFAALAQEAISIRDKKDMELIGISRANKKINLKDSSSQTISGTIQGRRFEDPKPNITLGVNGRGVYIPFVSMAKLQEAGLSSKILAHNTPVQATGKLIKGKDQDELDVETMTVQNKTYKVKDF